MLRFSAPILDKSGRPRISFEAQIHIYKLVHCKVRAHRLLIQRIPKNPGDLRFKPPVEYNELRSTLRSILQQSMTLEKGINLELVAQRLVVQEFSMEDFWPTNPKEDA